MPNGQDRRAEKARNRTPRKGRTIRMGKKLGTAPVECRIDDLARELLPRMSQLSKNSGTSGWSTTSSAMFQLTGNVKHSSQMQKRN